MRKVALIVILLVCALATSAFGTTYYSESEFLAAIGSDYYLEDFSTYGYGTLSGVLTLDVGPVNGYGYTISGVNHGGGGELFSNTGAISTNSTVDDLRVTFTGLSVTAVGGIFNPTDIDGYTIPGSIILTLSNGTTVELVNPGQDSFVGFTSATPISYLDIVAPDPVDVYSWPQMDHFYAGAVNPVPEPASMSLLLMGIAGIGGAIARRRKQ